MTSVLIIGSADSLNDGTYTSLISKHQSSPSVQVRTEMCDRLLQKATSLPPNEYANVVITLSDRELAQHLISLLSILEPCLIPNSGILTLANTKVGEELQSTLKDKGYTVTADQLGQLVATRNVKRKASPLPSDPSIVESTSKVALKLRPRNGGKKASLWAINHVNGATTPTIDQSTLLTEEDLQRRETIQRPDCDVKKTRKACKNCSCGLRELLLQEQDDLPNGSTTKSPAQAINGDNKEVVSSGGITSSCGSCYLGDAFRCASCPYLGLPAFEPGQKISLDSFADDI